MMLYSVRDLKVGKYGSPFIMDNDMSATRSFLLSLADAFHPSPMTAFPMDFELYQVGEFDFITGKLTPLPEGPRFVASVGSCQDQFSAMQKRYIELQSEISFDMFLGNLKPKLKEFKDVYLDTLAEKLEHHEYLIALDTFLEKFERLDNYIEEDTSNG